MSETRTVTCGVCGDTFEPSWSEEECIAEMERDFGNIPEEERMTVCDDCYQVLSPQNNMLLYAQYLEEVRRRRK